MRITNLTIIISSAGKSKWLMILGSVTIVANALLNFILYDAIGLVGPALSTLIVTTLAGVMMLYLDAKVLKSRLSQLIDFKYLLLFIVEAVVLTAALSFVDRALDYLDVHYFVILVLIAGVYAAVMLLLNFKRIVANMKKLNTLSKEKSQYQ
jgi:peptidoglycan biosynthesis protein MviN/MurJ (putative lipid II flippase)